jgi:hypothetical protein
LEHPVVRRNPVSGAQHPVDPRQSLVNASIANKLSTLRQEYERLTGSPFGHFYCPILLRDQFVELCEGHVVNQAFPGSERRTVVQRADVDSFFGTKFEGDFTLLAERGRHGPVDLLLDRRLARKLRPQLLIDGQPVEHYVSGDNVPSHHSMLLVEREGQTPIPLVLKLAPSDTLSALDANWEVEISRDVRLAALVSLLKSAHLSMFSLMGYSYALTAGGLFLGWEILGRFVARNLDSDPVTVLRDAQQHFREFVNLVRPMAVPPEKAAGTITDAQLFLCTGTPKAWAFMVLVRTGTDMHAVVVPMIEDEEGGARFARFLKDPAPRFEVKRIKFAGGRWELAKTGRIIDWPEANFS